MISTEELRAVPLFAGLPATELEYLARSVPDIVVTPGEYVFHEGEHDPALFVIIEGRFELTKTVEGEERIVGVRLPGSFIAEPSVVLNVPFLASMRATMPSRPWVQKLTSAGQPNNKPNPDVALLERFLRRFHCSVRQLKHRHADRIAQTRGQGHCRVTLSKAVLLFSFLRSCSREA